MISRRKGTKTFLKRKKKFDLILTIAQRRCYAPNWILRRRLLWFPPPPLSVVGGETVNCRAGRRGDVAQVRRTPPVATFAGGRHCRARRLQIQSFAHCTPPFCHCSLKFKDIKLQFQRKFKFIHLTWFDFEEFRRVEVLSWTGKDAGRVFYWSASEWRGAISGPFSLLPIRCSLLFSTCYAVHPPF